MIFWKDSLEENISFAKRVIDFVLERYKPGSTRIFNIYSDGVPYKFLITTREVYMNYLERSLKVFEKMYKNKEGTSLIIKGLKEFIEKEKSSYYVGGHLVKIPGGPTVSLGNLEIIRASVFVLDLISLYLNKNIFAIVYYDSSAISCYRHILAHEILELSIKTPIILAKNYVDEGFLEVLINWIILNKFGMRKETEERLKYEISVVEKRTIPNNIKEFYKKSILKFYKLLKKDERLRKNIEEFLDSFKEISIKELMRTKEVIILSGDKVIHI